MARRTTGTHQWSQVLHLLRGATNAEIGRLRGTSHHTVANQVQSIFERLGVRSRVELASRLGAI